MAWETRFGAIRSLASLYQSVGQVHMAWAWEHLANRLGGWCFFWRWMNIYDPPYRWTFLGGWLCTWFVTVRFNHFCLRWGHCAAYRIFLPLVTTSVTNSKQSLVFCKNGPLWPLWLSMAFWPPVTAVARMNSSWARPGPTRPRSPVPGEPARCAMQWLLSLGAASVASVAALKTDASIQTSVPWDPLGTHWEPIGNGVEHGGTVFLKWR